MISLRAPRPPPPVRRFQGQDPKLDTVVLSSCNGLELCHRYTLQCSKLAVRKLGCSHQLEVHLRRRSWATCDDKSWSLHLKTARQNGRVVASWALIVSGGEGGGVGGNKNIRFGKFKSARPDNTRNPHQVGHKRARAHMHASASTCRRKLTHSHTETRAHTHTHTRTCDFAVHA